MNEKSATRRHRARLIKGRFGKKKSWTASTLLRQLRVGFSLVFHLRERERIQSSGGVILHDVTENVSGRANFSANVRDAENQDEVEEPRHGVRARAGFRGREETDRSPQHASDHGGVDGGKFFIRPHGDLRLANRVERVDEVFQCGDDARFAIRRVRACGFRLVPFEDVQHARIEPLASFFVAPRR